MENWEQNQPTNADNSSPVQIPGTTWTKGTLAVRITSVAT